MSTLPIYTVTKVHVSDIRPSDTILVNGVEKTVSRSSIKRGFMGTTLFGDSYRSGQDPVLRCDYLRAVPVAK